MKKFNKVFLMVLVVLMVLAPACKTVDPDPIEQDDAQFVSVNSVVTARYDDFAHVSTTFVFRANVSAPTRLEGEAQIGEDNRLLGVDVPYTGQFTVVTETSHKFGTYNISGQVTLLSTGKVVVIPTTQFTVQ
jgi:hypothetical protein